MRLLLAFVQRTLLLIELIIARVAVEFATIDLDDLGDDAVHEFPIMRRHHQHAVITLQEFFQPYEAFQIEVVTGLVE